MVVLSSELLGMVLTGLVLGSAFFSGSETALMAIDRYRLHSAAKRGSKSALRVQRMLKRPDKLLGVILLGNTFANLLSASIATILGLRYFGENGIWISTVLLTIIILLFAELIPKTIAAYYSERFSLLVSLPLAVILRLFMPIVVVINFVVGLVCRVLGLKLSHGEEGGISADDLRGLLDHQIENNASHQHHHMMVGVLDLDKIEVNDVMVPRKEVEFIDISKPWPQVEMSLARAKDIQALICNGSIDDPVGFVQVSRLWSLKLKDKLTKKMVMQVLEQVKYIPEGTSLSNQLLNFKRYRYRMGLIVDEYGEIMGTVATEDILAEIVGEYSDPNLLALIETDPDVGGWYTLDGGLGVRDINRSLGWKLPVDGPVTLSGLIIERLERIPDYAMGLEIDGYRVEFCDIIDNQIGDCRVYPIPKEESSALHDS